MNVLDLPMTENDSEASTIRGYLKELLAELWDRKESFSGKRPFGNSGWEYDVYASLIAGGVIDGELDEDGHVNSIDEEMADKLIFQAIREL